MEGASAEAHVRRSPAVVHQALLSRGVTELLLTSDNTEGLKVGGVAGGIVLMHTHTHTSCVVAAPTQNGHTSNGVLTFDLCLKLYRPSTFSS